MRTGRRSRIYILNYKFSCSLEGVSVLMILQKEKQDGLTHALYRSAGCRCVLVYWFGDGFDHQVFSTPTPTATAELMGMGCLVGFQIY